MHNLTQIWCEVSSWPPEKRLALAIRLLQSLQRDGPVAVSKERQGLCSI